MPMRQMSSSKKADMEAADQATTLVGTIGGMVINIPHIGATPIKLVEKQVSIDYTESGETAGTSSFEDSEEELLQQVEATIGKRLSAVSECDAQNDSFINRLSALSQSSRKNPRNGASYAQFYIGDIGDDGDDGDFDVVSRASGLDTSVATHWELVDAVERLNQYLTQTELELSIEKKKRRARENNLIKLAKELGTQGKIIEGQHDTMSELKDELRSARADIALLETELKYQRFLNKETKIDSKKNYKRSIEEAQVVYNHTMSAHDRRIRDISKAHAKQCEELCREVIEANQEAARHRKKLKEMISSALAKNADRGLDVSQTSNVNLVLKMITVVVIAATAYIALSASGESPVGMCSGSPRSPKLVMINDQLFVPKARTIPEPTIAKRIDARQSVEAAAPPVKPRVMIEAALAHRPQIVQVRNSKLSSTETWIRRRAQEVVQMFSLHNRSSLLKGLNVTPDLPENALLNLIQKRN